MSGRLFRCLTGEPGKFQEMINEMLNAVLFLFIGFEILTWRGLRGGISVALALSLSASMHRDQFMLITYIIVVF